MASITRNRDLLPAAASEAAKATLPTTADRDSCRARQIIRRYWNWRSSSYCQDADKSALIAASWESCLQELLKDTPGKSALDVGTGTGQLAIYLARSGFRVTGIDLAESMLLRARQHAAAEGLQINFSIADAESLAFDTSSFAVIVARNLLWTLPHPHRALQEWYRVLRPGGRLVVSDGLWLNMTWKRLPALITRLCRRNGSRSFLRSVRFFMSYAGICSRLPLYEGVLPERAQELMQRAGFKDIASYDVNRFSAHPYPAGRHGKSALFFIAHASK